VQPDVADEAEPLLDLVDQLRADLVLLLIELRRQGRDPVVQRLDAPRRELRQAHAADGHEARLRVEPFALAFRAGELVHELRIPLPRAFRVGLVEHPLNVEERALVGPAALALPRAVVALVGHGDGLVRAVQIGVAEALRQRVPRCVQVDAVVLGQRHERARVPVVQLLAQVVMPARRAIHHGAGRVEDDEVGVHLQLDAQAVALVAHARGRVEAEERRLERLEAELARRAGMVLAQGELLRAAVRPGGLELDHPVAQAQRGLHRVHHARREPLRRCGDDDPVHHDVDAVLLVRVEAGQALGQVDRLAVDAGARGPVGQRLPEHLHMGALAVVDDRRQELHARACGEGGDLVGNLLRALRLDGSAALRAVGHADARVEHAQVIEDLGDRADSRARVMAERLLLNGDGRGEAADVVDRGLLHLVHELPGVGGEAFDITPLPFGVDGVECERRLARAADTGDDHEPVARDAHRDVLEVVLPRAAHDDVIGAGGRQSAAAGQSAAGGPAGCPTGGGLHCCVFCVRCNLCVRCVRCSGRVGQQLHCDHS